MSEKAQAEPQAWNHGLPSLPEQRCTKSLECYLQKLPLVCNCGAIAIKLSFTLVTGDGAACIHFRSKLCPTEAEGGR